ncbi:MAG: artP [Firmicutes bacterium]|nr:artP [Bacillota bacterium]
MNNHKLFSKAIISCILCIFCIAVLAGCGTNSSDNSANKPAAQSTDASKPLAGKKLVLAVNATFPPFESVKMDANGNKVFEGVDIDIVNYLAEQLGFTYEVTDMKFSGLVGALQSKRADFVISGISPTAERKENADFTESYFFPKTAILCKKGSNLTTKDSLENKKVSTSFGSTYEKLAKSIPGVEVVSVDSSTVAVQEVVNGRVDAAIIDALQSEKFLNADNTLEKHIISEETIPLDESFAIACQKNSELTKLFDAELAKMKQNGKLNEIIKKWVGDEYVVK